MLAMRVKTSNFKISVISCSDVVKNLRAAKNVKVNYWSNFLTFRSKYAYIIFLNGHINVTGIRSRSEIEDALREVRHLFRLQPDSELQYKIDNICASGYIESELNLPSIYMSVLNHLKDCPLSLSIISASYRPEKFPAFHLKTKLGSILLFRSGKFVFVGYRRCCDAFYLYTILSHFIKLWKKERDEPFHCRNVSAFSYSD